MNGSAKTDRGSVGEFTALLDDSQGNRLAEFLLQKHAGPKRPRPETATARNGRLKNLVIPSSYRLRRNRLKFLSYITERRSLLKEFENTVTDSNFMPFVCSTPLTPSMVQKQPTKTDDVTFVSIKTTQKDNEEMTPSLPKQGRESKVGREVCDEVTSHEGTAPSLPKKDTESKSSQEVRDEVILHGKKNRNSEGVIESNGLRTFTIQKDLDRLPRPGGTYSLTRPPPDSEGVASVPNTTSAQFDMLKGQSENLPDILIALPKVVQKSKESINRSKPFRISRFTPNKLQVKMCPADSGNTSAKVSTVQNLIEVSQLQAISDKDDEIEIPETQQSHTVETSKERLSEKQRRQEAEPVAIHRTFTMYNSQESRRLSHRSLNCPNKNENHHESSSETIANKTKEKSQKEKFRSFNRSQTKSPRVPDVDDMRFCDILNDEEERERGSNTSGLGGITSINASTAQRSSVPLNLAANQTAQCTPSPAETRRLRRRSRRQLENKSQRQRAKAVIGPPEAHITVTRTRTNNRRTKIPMNAAPCTPINGEPFATEIKNNLARLNNREILDLRLRNSLGEVFPTSGRRMSTSATKQALEQKEKLEKELQFEILKRNLNDDFNKIVGGNEIGSGDERQVSEGFWYEIMPAPHDYRDEPSKHQQTVQTESIPAGIMMSSSNDNAIENNSKRRSNSAPNEMPTSASITQHRKTQLNIISQTEVDDGNLFKIPPAPGFRDDVSQTPSVNLHGLHMEGKEPNATLIHDSLHEQVTFRPTNSNNVTGLNNGSRRGRSAQSIKSMPDVLKKYMDNQNQLGQSKNRGISTKIKRSLYSGDSDTSIDEGDKISDKNIAGENVENELASTPALPVSVAALPEPVPVLPIPVSALSEAVPASPVPLSVLSEPVSPLSVPVPALPEPVPTLPAPLQTIPHPLPASSVKEVQENVLPILEMAGSSLPEKRYSGIFKKPQTPSQNKPKRTTSRRKNIATELGIPGSTTSSSEGTVTSTNSSNQDNDETATLRRSKRGPKPFKNYWSFRSTDPTPLYDFSLYYKKLEEQKERRKRKKTNSSSATASGQTTALSSSSGISNSTNTHETENLRKRKPRKKNGNKTDSNSLSSGSAAASTQPKRLSVIAEFEN